MEEQNNTQYTFHKGSNFYEQYKLNYNIICGSSWSWCDTTNISSASKQLVSWFHHGEKFKTFSLKFSRTFQEIFRMPIL